jgi:DNA-directed RNA polymerase specialized sigma24 family protein
MTTILNTCARVNMMIVMTAQKVAPREDLRQRLSAIADDAKVYINLQDSDLQELLECSPAELEDAMVTDLIPTPQEMRENVFLDLHSQGLTAQEIAEASGIKIEAVTALAAHFRVQLKPAPLEVPPWTVFDESFILRSF